MWPLYLKNLYHNIISIETYELKFTSDSVFPSKKIITLYKERIKIHHIDNIE